MEELRRGLKELEVDVFLEPEAGGEGLRILDGDFGRRFKLLFQLHNLGANSVQQNVYFI